MVVITTTTTTTTTTTITITITIAIVIMTIVMTIRILAVGKTTLKDLAVKNAVAEDASIFSLGSLSSALD
ncbi:hypothetical protein [Alkalihalophilus marmarensis]|uniref:hypothetical protein n=1 Tax=Alkalihalophilus marmarensis TaxID=521377 RepID=UPI002E1ACD05|nr:hypothetical protein [Alkalihalophilus marmarensis]